VREHDIGRLDHRESRHEIHRRDTEDAAATELGDQVGKGAVTRVSIIRGRCGRRLAPLMGWFCRRSGALFIVHVRETSVPPGVSEAAAAASVADLAAEECFELGESELVVELSLDEVDFGLSERDLGGLEVEDRGEP
jgi:hypothetical protein